MNKPFNKTLANSAVAILLSLGVTACSSGGGSNGMGDLQSAGISTDATEKTKVTLDNKTTTGSANNTQNLVASAETIEATKQAEAAKKAEAERLAKEAEEAAKKAEAERLAKEAEEAAKKAEAERLAKETEEAAKKAEEERLAKEAAKAEADKIANNLSSVDTSNTNLATTAYLTDSAKNATLKSVIESNNSTCKPSKLACLSGAAKGDIIFSDKQSYSGYAVIREETDADRTVPANAYVAVVNTPTTDKALVVNAKYKGTAVYTAKHLNSYTGYAASKYSNELIMTVTDSKISGALTMTTGKTPRPLADFNETEIKVGNNAVIFSGTAVFKKAIGITLDEVTGTYKGQFAGANAEEVVGTFETPTTDKANSVQGAFMATKEASTTP